MLIEQVIITGFIVMAIWATFWPDAIFGFVADWLSDRIPKILHKPVFDCSVCMTPWYGSIAYWLIWGNSWQEWLVVIIAAMGMNAVLIKLFPPDE